MAIGFNSRRDIRRINRSVRHTEGRHRSQREGSRVGQLRGRGNRNVEASTFVGDARRGVLLEDLQPSSGCGSNATTAKCREYAIGDTFAPNGVEFDVTNRDDVRFVRAGSYVIVEPTRDGEWVVVHWSPSTCLDATQIAFDVSTGARGPVLWQVNFPAETGRDAPRGIDHRGDSLWLYRPRTDDNDVAQVGLVRRFQADSGVESLAYSVPLDSYSMTQVVGAAGTDDGGVVVAAALDLQLQPTGDCVWYLDGAGALVWTDDNTTNGTNPAAVASDGVNVFVAFADRLRGYDPAGASLFDVASGPVDFLRYHGSTLWGIEKSGANGSRVVEINPITGAITPHAWFADLTWRSVSITGANYAIRTESVTSGVEVYSLTGDVLQWSFNGRNLYDGVSAMDTDGTGNVFAAGFDRLAPNAPWLYKFDPVGNLQWVSEQSYDQPVDLLASADGSRLWMSGNTQPQISGE